MWTLIGKKTCSTCREVEKLAKQVGLNYRYREITQEIPSADELADWFAASGETSPKKLMNTSGDKYRQENYKDRLACLPLEEQWALIAQDGMLIKRPLLVGPNGQVYIGSKVKTFLSEFEKGDTNV
ncbi:ArsC/Spx/MgsR family protein [Vaginisenegalia massiliensis]|uniref:ArsC/Spx/MgsR family protein n=1 Tax=Vaginisenegalia massiliensis TaxID=2058294 RepID=UPI000F53F03F|nr:ArsC/Spx/MgsR family protein [Vaginisenegalia massiliensis]